MQVMSSNPTELSFSPDRNLFMYQSLLLKCFLCSCSVSPQGFASRCHCVSCPRLWKSTCIWMCILTHKCHCGPLSIWLQHFLLYSGQWEVIFFLEKGTVTGYVCISMSKRSGDERGHTTQGFRGEGQVLNYWARWYKTTKFLKSTRLSFLFPIHFSLSQGCIYPYSLAYSLPQSEDISHYLLPIHSAFSSPPLGTHKLYSSLNP